MRKLQKWPHLLLAVCAATLGSAPVAQAVPTLVASVPVGQQPAGTAVNTLTNRVYVANQADNTVTVVNGADNTMIGAPIAVGTGPRGVAVSESANRIYVANGTSNNLSVIDGTTNVALVAVPVGTNPSDVDVNEATNRIYVTNEGSGNVTVIDGTTNLPIDTDGNTANGITPIAIGPAASVPNSVAVNATTNRIYVTAGNGGTTSTSGGGMLYIINGVDNSVASVPVGTNAFLGSSPRGVAVNEVTNRVYVVALSSTNNALVVFNGADNARLAQLNFPSSNTTSSLDVDPGTNRIYVQNSVGNLGVVNGVDNTLITSVTIPNSRVRSNNVSVNSVTKRIYVTTTSFTTTTNFLRVVSDLPDIVQFAAATSSVNEGAGTATISVTRTGTPVGTFSVSFATADGTAVAPFDYTATSGTLTFADGVTTQNITVPITFNAISEGDETFSITLSAPTNGATLGTPSASTVTITESAVPAPSQTIFAITGSNRLVRFNSNTPGSIDNMVPISGLQGGEVLVGIDFRPLNGALYGLTSQSRLYTINTFTGAATLASTLSVALNGTSFGVDFNPVPDRLRVVSDADQSLRINVDTGATIVDGSLAYDTDTDGTGPDTGDVNAGANPNVVASGYTNSFAGATTTALYDIDSALDILALQSPPNDGTLATRGALGINTSDIVGFDIAPDNTAFAALTQAGAASRLFTINLDSGRANDLGQITFPDAIRGIAVALPGTISLSAAMATVAENAGSVAVTLTRTGSNATAVTVTVANGTATGGSDFTDVSGRVTFAAGEASRTITIPILNDGEDEADETFTVTLSAPENATIIAPVAQTITITDDDAPRVISISNIAVTEGDRGTVNAIFTVTLSTPSASPVSVNFATADGTATAPSDYAPISGTLSFAPGETSKTITVQVLGDLISEGNETFALNLSNAINATPTAASGVGAITDDDAALLTLAIAPGIVSESAGANAATGTLSRSTQSTSALTVTLTSSSTSDITVPASVTIPAGAASVTFAVSAMNNAVVDGDATVTITAAAAGFPSDSETVTVTDDESPAPANSIPVAVADSYSTTGRVIRVAAPGVLANDRDADGTALRAVLRQGPSHGILSFNANGSFTYTPSPTYGGTDTFMYIASDGALGSVPVTVTLRVGRALDITAPFVSLTGGTRLTVSRLIAPRGITADIYAIRGRGVVPSSGLRGVVLRLQRPDGQFFNGRTFQRATFDLPAALIGRSFFLLANSMPPASLTPDGRYLVTAIATDNAGNRASVQQTIFVDTTSPQIVISTPAGDASNTARITSLPRVSGRASGASGVRISVRRADGFYFNGTGYQRAPFFLTAPVVGGVYSVSAGLPSGANLPAGRYTLDVRATDDAGNIGAATRALIVGSVAAG